MRIVLSRKGLDSSAGGFPSPILPDGQICWIPIPTTAPKNCKYQELRRGDLCTGDLCRDLSGSALAGDTLCHLDPDLHRDVVARRAEWRACFGQCSVAESHLSSNQVDVGDLFLYFGWFRRADILRGQWSYVKDAKDIHILFGWLQIGEIYSVTDDQKKIPAYARHHTHYRNREEYLGERE